MYEYIKGKVVSVKEDYIVLDNNGIGYKIFTSENSRAEITSNEERKMYIYYNQREDGVYLYGFLEEEELDMFNYLLLVSKVGPKTALGVLSTLTPFEIREAVLNRDVKSLCQAPGIGKKTAERIILELKDRLEKTIFSDSGSIETVNSNLDIAVAGLETLGYNKREIESVLIQQDISGLSEEDIIKLFLKNVDN